MENAGHQPEPQYCCFLLLFLHSFWECHHIIKYYNIL